MSQRSLPSSSALDAAVLNLVREEVLQTPPGFGTESDLFSAGLDSMAIMQLLLLLEERFGVSLRGNGGNGSSLFSCICFRSGRARYHLRNRDGRVRTGRSDEKLPVVIFKLFRRC